ncbi:MAG: DNA-binding protein [Aminobacterium colombiense]|jgi:hypothetical protein|uniref:Nucleic acid binding OB-fold tRNA/helicase-type n=1 Tax=Aminobacterium colombiense (strain DSM 12261 / ALA-1) TaxID=572547 RepID=D5EHA6_AMICL|nr:MULTISPECIES: hypothetical protein [Aminobacterium]ADE57938.1 hypothetical protein Amico_1825 [Aminobacterium colombiense DSM 12261]MDD2379284.1 DNA-binding protein [Aminobacterium colombiense]MDD4265770.1 DNA-binding protein [Aminobacterium colombiense]NLK31092.1 DNA-binding protein [Aminobacterium colombiense]
MLTENIVTVAGTLHHVQGNRVLQSRLGEYVTFSVKQETPWEDGSTRRDFLLMRAYDPELRLWILGRKEGTPVRVEGDVRSSLGSGEMYVLVRKIEEA